MDLLCTYFHTEVDRGPDGRRLPFTLTQPFRFTVPPVLWFLVLAASFPFRFINFLTKALSIYVPLVSRTVLLDLALPDTWDYKAPSTAPDFFPQLCNGEGRNFFCEKTLGDFHGVRTCDPWISPWNDRNKPAALPTAPRGLGLLKRPTTTTVEKQNSRWFSLKIASMTGGSTLLFMRLLCYILLFLLN